MYVIEKKVSSTWLEKVKGPSSDMITCMEVPQAGRNASLCCKRCHSVNGRVFIGDTTAAGWFAISLKIKQIISEHK